MRKDTKTAKLTKIEIDRNKQISKKRYIRFQPVGPTGRRVEQYFGLSHLHDGAYRARFTTILKNIWDSMPMARNDLFGGCREMLVYSIGAKHISLVWPLICFGGQRF